MKESFKNVLVNMKNWKLVLYIHCKLINHNIDFVSPVILAHDNVKLRLQVKETILKNTPLIFSLNSNAVVPLPVGSSAEIREVGIEKIIKK